MSYKRNQRRKWQRREQPAWYATEPKWSALNAARNARIFYHPLAGLPLRGAGTAAHLRKFYAQGLETIPYVRHSARTAQP